MYSREPLPPPRHRGRGRARTGTGPLEDADGPRDFVVEEGQALRFVLPAGVPHAMLNTGNAPMLILSFNTEVHDPANPDVVHREVLIETP